MLNSPEQARLLPACPICGQTDSIQIVPDVYKAGYIELPRPPIFGLAKSRRLDVRQIPGVSQLNILSAVLAPPVEPVFNGVIFSSRGEPGPKYMRDWPAAVFAALRYAATAGLVGYGVGYLTYPLIGGWLGWVTFIVLLVWLLVRRFQNERRQADAVRRDQAHWEKELDAWQRLVYCAQDDVVFLPGSSKTARPQDWRSLLSG